MKPYYLSILTTIEEKLEKFYGTNFTNADEEIKINKDIKKNIQEVIIQSNADSRLSVDDKQSIVDEALFLLSRHTGCVDDEIISDEILDYLFNAKKIIKQRDLDRYYSNPSINRWR